MFRRRLLHQLGGYRAGDFPEDYELWLRWLDAGVRFAKVADEVLVWNDPPQRLSRTDRRYRSDAFYQVKCHYLARWLRRRVEPHRRIWLWGAGRVTRKRFHYLAAHGIPIAGYVDIDPRKIGRRLHGCPVIAPEQLPSSGTCFVLSGVGSWAARDQIASRLVEQGRQEGEDFLLAA